MNSSIRLDTIMKSASQFFHRFHVVIFTTLVVGGLALATFILYQATVTDTASTTTDKPSVFNDAQNKKTIDQIESFTEAENSPTNYSPSPGRNNPFM